MGHVVETDGLEEPDVFVTRRKRRVPFESDSLHFPGICEMIAHHTKSTESADMARAIAVPLHGILTAERLLTDADSDQLS